MKKFFKWVGIIFLVFIAIGIIASMGEDEATPTNDNSNNQSEEVSGNVENNEEENDQDESNNESDNIDTYNIGDEVNVGDLSYIVHGVEEMETIESGNEFIDDVTTSGKFVVVDLTVKNNDSEARFIDSEMFRLIEDDETEYSPSSDADMLINDGDLGFFLAEVNPKMDMRGKVAFEVHSEFKGKIQVSSGFGWSGGEYAEITY